MSEDLTLTSREERIRAATGGDDVIRAILLDHADIKDLLAETTSARDAETKRRAFVRLVCELAVHETAEAELVHSDPAGQGRRDRGRRPIGRGGPGQTDGRRVGGDRP